MSDRLLRESDVLEIFDRPGWEAFPSPQAGAKAAIRALPPDPRAEAAERLAQAVGEFKQHTVLRGGNARQREEQYRAEDELNAALAAYREASPPDPRAGADEEIAVAPKVCRCNRWGIMRNEHDYGCPERT